MESKRKIVQIDEERCDGCGQCITSCAEGAIEIVDGKAKVIKDSYCDGLGACLGNCPQDALTIIEREAEPFDHEAVERHLEEREKAQQKAPGLTMACGCPSSNIRMFNPGSQEAKQPSAPQDDVPSALTHWPVQIRLVPPTAPFLKGADLLVAADCVPAAYPKLHQDLLPGKVILLGCPKFDDANAYVKKFSEIFSTADIRSVTVVDMEVPCCSALPMIVKKGMEAAAKNVPTEEVVISVRGEVIKRKAQAA